MKVLANLAMTKQILKFELQPYKPIILLNDGFFYF
jgi:hypothetical protein